MSSKLFNLLFGTLRRQLIVGVAVVHAVMMTLFITDLTRRQQVLILDRQTEHATALAQMLATSAADWLASDDVSGLQELADAQRRYPDLTYAMLLNNQGQVLAHTDRARLGLYLLDLPGDARQTVLSRSAALVDIIVPAMLADRQVGWARVGIGQHQSAQKLAAITRNGVLYAIIAILIGSLLALLMGKRITRRLYEIQSVMDEVRSGNHQARSHLTGPDEAAGLANNFNIMLNMLGRANEALEKEIAEHKRTEATLHGLNRELRAISNCNQTLLRATEEPTLLNDICRIVCNEAGYHMAWVGFAGQDEAKTVRPVAWAGVEDGYLKTAGIVWSDTERGRGPTGTAIRTGKTSQVRDFATDLATEPWRAEAARRGYRCNLALPLKDEAGTVFGALTIYAVEPNAFTPEEVRLLEELAGDLAFGINVLRERNERQRAEERLRRSENGLAEAQRIAHLGNWELDLVNNVLTWSGEIYRIFEINPEEFGASYEAFLNAIHPEDREKVNQAYTDSLKNKAPYDIVHRLQMPDGRIKYVHEKCETHYGADGQPLRSIGTVHDITEGKQAEQEAALLNFALNNVREAVFLIGEEARFHFVNEESCRVLGYPQAELLGMGVPDVDPDFPGHRWAAHWEELKAKRSLVFEGRHRTRDGRIFPVEVSANLIEYDGKTYNLALVRDITERKRIEQGLRETEERFAAAFHASPNLITITRMADGKIVDVNEGYTKLLGYSRDESIGKTTAGLSIWANPADRATFISTLEKFGEITNFETPLRRKDGTIVTVLDSARTIALQGETCILSAVYDITERKQAEEALRWAGVYNRSLIEACLDPLVTIGPDGQITDVNSATEKATGCSRAALIGTDFSDYFTKPEQARAGYLQVFHDGFVRDYPLELRHRDGHITAVLYNASVYRDEHGKVTGVFAAARDITERKRVEDALLFIAQRGWQTGAENFFDALAQFLGQKLDMEYVLIDRVDENPEMAETLALYAKGAIMPNLRYALKGTPCENVMGRRLCVYPQNVQQLFPEDILLPEMGAESYIGIPLWDSTGRPIGLIAVMGTKPLPDDAPVTQLLQLVATRAAAELERKRAEKEIRTLNQELEQRVAQRTAQLETANKELESFSYSVSHDLRAPLRAIDGFSRILLEDYAGQLDAAGKDSLTRVRAATQRMGRLIDDLLQLSRHTRTEMHCGPVDLSGLASVIVDELKVSSPPRPVAFVCAPDLVAQADAGLMRVALENLLGNAWKFTGKQAAAKIEFGRTTHDGVPAYFVRDNGVGFDMTYADKLFGAFQRLHAVTDFPGTGIGLATVQRIIHRHGGRVWAESQAGHGATFYFTLPDNNRMPL